MKPEFRGQAFGPEIPVLENAPVYDRLAAYFGRTRGWALEDSGTARRRLRCLESAAGRTRHSSQVTRTFPLHRHSDIGYHTPESVHDGLAAGIREQRAAVLEAAYSAHPERFIRGKPVWIQRRR